MTRSSGVLPSPPRPGASGRAVLAPWFSARDVLRSRLSHKQASGIGDAVARLLLGHLLSACERQFDFPVAGAVSAAPLLLIRIPKTASPSLALQVYGQVSRVPHRSAAFYGDADPAFFARATSFAVVRDLWDRAASAYRWLRGRGNEFAAPDRRGRASVARVDTFERFVFDVLELAAAVGRLRHLNPVLQRQSDSVCEGAGRGLVDRLFRLERMAKVKAFLAANGISGGEVHANASVSGGDDAVGRASRGVLDAIGRISAQDAALFGSVPSQPRP